ncbi:MAG: ECF-type sigma factor [Lysobacterales bacterium]
MAYLTFKRLADDPVSDWLQRWAEGDAEAAGRLAEGVYPLFERAARDALRGNPAGAGDLDTRALIAEVWIRLTPRRQSAFENRHAFFGAAIRQMHYVLIDRFRKALAEQRVFQRQRPVEAQPSPNSQSIALQQALQWLSAEHERPAQALLLRELLGLSLTETATVLEVSLATAKRDLAYATARLRQRLGSEPGRAVE